MAQLVFQTYASRGTHVEQRPTRRVYAITTTNLLAAPSVVRGNFLVCNFIVNVLIDTGAPHSFISFAFASALRLEVAQLASPLRVESPVCGEIVLH